ncbi:uncharacterized protein [Oryza sativa Japonica Group]|uniref:uncharacterized protein n=1 Tax=Oryza sativa subsp. japonica TaxID=39947 RepID=UPI0007753A4F|nr:uncharacterized protein LOC4329255 [Oryza sativa Japonica Group]
MISGPTTASNVPVPLCEKGAAEHDVAINALPLTDIIEPLVDHLVAASLKEKVAKEASDAAAAAAITSGGNVPKKGRTFSSVVRHRRKTSTPSASDASPTPPRRQWLVTLGEKAARPKAAQDGSRGTSNASPVVVAPRSREATPNGLASDLAAGRGLPAAVLTWEELQVEMGCLLEAGARGIGHEITEVKAAAASSANERADRLARDLAEVREDLHKMRELVAGNERQRQGLKHRMSELENHLSEIRGSLQVTYTGMHQLAG